MRSHRSARWRAASATAAAAALLLTAAAAPAARAPHVDYLYAEANEDGSSGGHVALRLGRDVYHFQQAGDGLLRMRRDDANTFRVHYALLGNRPIHEQRIAVRGETVAALRATFDRRLLIETAQYERRDALADDVSLFAAWQRYADEGVAPAVAVRGAGFFVGDGFTQVRADPAAASPGIAAVRGRVVDRRGAGFLDERAAALRAELAAFRPAAVSDPPPPLDRDVYPQLAPTTSTLYRERLEALTAFEVLATAAAPRPEALRLATDQPPLDAAERRALRGYAEQLGANLAALAESSRPDIGYPLLLGLARLAAIEATLAGGRPVLLDTFPVDATAASLPDGAERDAALAALAAQLAPLRARARSELFAAGRFREADYTYFEAVGNRTLEIAQARARQGPLRLDRGAPLPDRPARRSGLPAPPLTAAELAGERAAAELAATRYRERLAPLYGYDLIGHNCVHAVFATIDAALGDGDPGAAAPASRAQLGGVVQVDGTLNFIPFLSAAAVERAYAPSARRTRPSYRQWRVAQLAAVEPAWRVALRESNTLTSTAYRPTPRDSTFLFFTDDAPLLRPLLGAANLLVGLGGGAAGLVTSPFDGGARFGRGVRGVLYSLPELAFVNIRKGTMAYVPTEAMPR